MKEKKRISADINRESDQYSGDVINFIFEMGEFVIFAEKLKASVLDYLLMKKYS